MRTGLIKRRIFPWVVLMGMVAVGVSGCVLVPLPLPLPLPGFGTYAPGYGPPPSGYGAPAYVPG
jgi:hypothetical protein